MATSKSYFHSNVRFLRKRNKRTQEVFAKQLLMTRDKLQAIESGKTRNPLLDDLIRFAGHFNMSIDSLVKIDFRKLSESKLQDLQQVNIEQFNNKLRVLSITTDRSGNENVHYIPVKARAGYVSGYNDPEFLATLPQLRIPQLPSGKSFRMFQITGDSMLPFQEGNCIIGEFVEDWVSIKDGTLCVLILKEAQDIVFKKVTNQLRSKGKLVLSSLNRVYSSYALSGSEVLEIWKYHSHWSSNIPNDTSLDEIYNKVDLLYNLLVEKK